MSLGGLLLQGGWMMLPIGLCSIAAMTIFLYKWQELRKAGLSETGWFDDVLKTLPVPGQDLNEVVTASNHPAARVVQSILDAHQGETETCRGRGAAGRQLRIAEVREIPVYTRLPCRNYPTVGSAGHGYRHDRHVHLPPEQCRCRLECLRRGSFFGYL